MLDLKNIDVIYAKGTPYEKHALKNFSIHLDKGDFICIIGGNGAGKSTLMSSISGEVELIGGKVILDGQDITDLPVHKRANYIGRLFQDPLKGTSPNMTIEENLSLAYGRGVYPGFTRGVKKQNKDLFKTRLREFDLGLETRMDTKVKYLSGGQRQALTLIMATIKTPKLLLLDEHTAALDPKTSMKVMEKTGEIVEKYNLTTIMITHNLTQAIEYGNKIAMINYGQLVKLIDKKTTTNISRQMLMEMYSQRAKDEFDDRTLLEN